jgi:membrane-bound ClpP family serine protease
VAPEFWTYVVAQLASWSITGLAVFVLYRLEMLRGWMAAALLGVLILKDLLLFPHMRKYYRPVASERRIVGRSGTALMPIAPRGFIRVDGELWQAYSDRPISEGARVRVDDVEGLLLYVHDEAEQLDRESDDR